MDISEAIAIVIKHVQETGQPPISAVRDLWNKLGPFSEEDVAALMQQALASRVGPKLNNPLLARPAILADSHKESRVAAVLLNTERNVPALAPAPAPAEKTVTVQVQMEKRESRVVHVSILHDASYTVFGKQRTIIDMNRYEVGEMVKRSVSARDGLTRFADFWSYLHVRMQELGKKQVSDLADGEIQKIARMFTDVRLQKDPLLQLT